MPSPPPLSKRLTRRDNDHVRLKRSDREICSNVWVQTICGRMEGTQKHQNGWILPAETLHFSLFLSGTCHLFTLATRPADWTIWAVFPDSDSTDCNGITARAAATAAVAFLKCLGLAASPALLAQPCIPLPPLLALCLFSLFLPSHLNGGTWLSAPLPSRLLYAGPGATSALLFIGLSAGHSLRAFLAAIHPRRPQGRARPRDVTLGSFFASNNKLHSLKINFMIPSSKTPPATASAAHCLSSQTSPNKRSASSGPVSRAFFLCGFSKCNHFSAVIPFCCHILPRLNSLHCNIARSRRRERADGGLEMEIKRGRKIISGQGRKKRSVVRSHPLIMGIQLNLNVRS